MILGILLIMILAVIALIICVHIMTSYKLVRKDGR